MDSPLFDSDSKIPFFSKAAHSFPISLPPSKKSPSPCNKRKSSNPNKSKSPLSLISIKFSPKRVLFFYHEFFIEYSPITQETLSHISPKPIDFALINEDFSLIMLFSTNSQGSIDYSFITVSYSSLLEKYEPFYQKNSYKMKDFLAVELAEKRIFSFTIEKKLMIYGFNAKRDFIILKNMDIFMKIGLEFENLYISGNFEDVFIAFSEKNKNLEKKKTQIFNYNIELASEDSFSIDFNEKNEKIQGIFRQNADFMVFTKKSLIIKSKNDEIKVNFDEENIKFSCFNEKDSQLVIITPDKIKLFHYNSLEKSFEMLDSFNFSLSLVQNSHFLYISQAKNAFLLINPIKNPENLAFELISLQLASAETVLLQVYEEKNDEKANFLLKKFNFDEDKLLKKRFLLSPKRDEEILEILLGINDLDFIETAITQIFESPLIEESKSLNIETFMKLFLKEWDLLTSKFRAIASIEENPYILLELYRKLLENHDKSQALKAFSQLKKPSNDENSSIDIEEFKNFLNKDKIELFFQYLIMNKTRSASILLENYKELIFGNYWKLFEKEGVFSRFPEKLLVILPRNQASKANICKSPSQNLDFKDFFWETYNKTTHKSLFSQYFLRNFPEIQLKTLENLLISAKTRFLDNSTLFLNETHNLNTIETYEIISKSCYFITGNPENALIFLEYGYKEGFDLKRAILLYKMFTLLINSIGFEDFDIKDYESLSETEKIGLLIEGNIKDNQFIELLKGNVRDLYIEYAEERDFYRDLKAFAMGSHCSVKIFIELLKMQLNFIENANELLGFVEIFKETRMFCEHYKEISVICDLLKAKASNCDDYIEELEKTSEIANILYVFSINMNVSAIKTMDFIVISEEILQNYFLNRRKDDRIAISGELLFLDPVSSQNLMKVLFFLRDLCGIKVKDIAIYQILVRKLLENSKFSLLRELLDRDKLLKKLPFQVFEGLIAENIEKVYRSSNEIGHIEYSLKKSLDLLPNDSVVKKSEKALFEAIKRLDELKIKGLALGEIRNIDKNQLLRKIIENLKEKASVLPLIELKKLFSEFENRDYCETTSDCELIKDFAYLLITQFQDHEAAKPLISILEQKGSFLVENLTTKLLENRDFLSEAEELRYKRLSILNSRNSDVLIGILDFEVNLAADIEKITEIIIENRLLLDNSQNITTKSLISLYNGIIEKINEGFSLFFRDLTIRPERAFFQLILMEYLSIETLEEIAITLLKSNFFNIEKLCIAFLLVVYIRNGIMGMINIEKLNDFIEKKNNFKTIYYEKANFEKKTMGFIEKIESFLDISRKMPKIAKFLNNPNEIKRFFWDNAYRNEKLVSILFQTHDLELFDDFHSLIKTPSFNIRDLFISKLVKDFSECDKNTAFADFQRLSQFTEKSLENDDKTRINIEKRLENIQKIYEKVRFVKTENLTIFLDVVIGDLMINEKKLLALFFLNELLKGANEIRFLIPDIRELFLEFSEKNPRNSSETPEENNGKSRNPQQLYPFIEESTVFLIAKSAFLLTENPIIEEKIYYNFIKKLLKNLDIHRLSPIGSFYDYLLQEMQKILIILPRIQSFSRLQKTLILIAKKPNIANIDLFEIYSNIYTFTEEKLKSRFPDRQISEFLNNAASLIDFKMRILRFSHKFEAKNSELQNKIAIFKEESLYEEETLFELIEILIFNEKNGVLELEIVRSMNIDLFERYIIQKIRSFILEIGEIEDLKIISKKIAFNEYEKKGDFGRSFMKIKRFLMKFRTFMEGIAKNWNNEKIWHRIIAFLIENIAFQEDLKSEIRLFCIEMLREEWKLKDFELEKAGNMLKFEVFIENYRDSEDIDEESNFVSVKNDEFIEKIATFPMVFLVNYIQVYSEKLEILLKDEKDMKKLLFLTNLGLFTKENGLILEIKSFLNNIEDLNKDKLLAFIENFNKNHNNDKEILYKFLLSIGALADLLYTDQYSQILDYFLHISHSYKPNFNEFYEKFTLKRGVFFENQEELLIFQEKCWFGRSFFEVLLLNIVRLIEKNEYYDAAKVNYLAVYKAGSLADIGTMMNELKRFLEEVEKRKEGIEAENEWLGKKVRNCIEVLKKLNK